MSTQPPSPAGFALVDVKNFYVSCERVFDPKLHTRPVVVLSNNDGCAVARSNEAKSLSVKMAAPCFMMQDLARQRTLFGNGMSAMSSAPLMAAFDSINQRFGRDTVRLASAAGPHRWARASNT